MLQGTSADTGSEDSQYEIEKSLRFSKVHQQAYLDRGLIAVIDVNGHFHFGLKGVN